MINNIMQKQLYSKTLGSDFPGYIKLKKALSL
jgi:hypothetical protein